MGFNQIDLQYSHGLSVTWDIGRRCNLDCTYCPSYRHDNHSPFADLHKLKLTGDFVFKYLDLYMSHRVNKEAKIDFTGGEPTINPEFQKFSRWLRETHENDYKNRYRLEICLTSNGILNERMRQNVVENFDYATFSHHIESSPPQKKRFIENIKFFKEKKFRFKVNVMFHARPDYFNECMFLSKTLKQMDVDFVPRLIGEKDNKDRYNHQYSPEQLAWIKSYWRNPNEAVFKISEKDEKVNKTTIEKKSGCTIGRPCCGSRSMFVGDAKETTYVSSTNFKNWYCAVNWFFLHIEQQTGEVFHHQTCQARFDHSRGPIGRLDNTEVILTELERRMKAGQLPIIKCSKKTCACGLCAPKARNLSDLHSLLPRHVNEAVFKNNSMVNISDEPN